MEVLFLFATFFKIGLFTIGGGYAMIPLIQAEVIKNQWISEQALVNFIAIAESTPGPFAINIATFVGMETAGIFGAFMSTLGVIMPSFVIILVIAKYFHTFKDNKYVKAGLSGLRPTVIGLMLSAGFGILITNLFYSLDTINSFATFFTKHINYKSILIFALLFFLHKKFKLHPILLVVISAVLGILLYGVLPF